MFNRLFIKISLVLAVLLWIDIDISAQKIFRKIGATVQSAKPIELSEQTKQEMINFVVTDFFVRLKENKIKPNKIDKCVFVPSGEKTSVIFSLRNINRDIFPEVEDYKFIFLSDEEIYSQASVEKPVCYLGINSVNIVENEVWISISRFFKKPDYIYANIFSYNFKKVKGKWVGQYVSMKTLES